MPNFSHSGVQAKISNTVDTYINEADTSVNNLSPEPTIKEVAAMQVAFGKVSFITGLQATLTQTINSCYDKVVNKF